MERFILKKLLDWKNSPYCKPLILKGIRQVGKTWILKEFGRRCYENTAYFNFDENEEYKQFFETTKDVDRILLCHRWYAGVGIDVDGGTGCFCYAGSIVRNHWSL